MALGNGYVELELSFNQSDFGEFESSDQLYGHLVECTSLSADAGQVLDASTRSGVGWCLCLGLGRQTTCLGGYRLGNSGTDCFGLCE